DGANGNAADLTSKISSFWSTNAVNALAYDATSGAVYIGGSGGKFGRFASATPGTFNFTTAVAASSGTVAAGASVSPNPTFTATLTYGTTAPNPTTFSVDTANLPTGVSVEFVNPSPASPCTLTSAQTCAAQITISTSQSSCTATATRFCPVVNGVTPGGDYVIPLKASVAADATNTITKEATYKLTVTEEFDFSMAWQTPCTSGTSCANPANIKQGQSISITFDVLKIKGTVSETVSLSGSASPSQGISVSMPASCLADPLCDNIGGTVLTTFTGDSASDVTTGAKTVTITGVSLPSGKTHTLTLTFTVDPGYAFSLQFTNNGSDFLSGGAYVPGTASPSPTLRATYTSGPSSGSFNVTFAVTTGSSYLTTSPATLSSCTFNVIGSTCDRPFDINATAGLTTGNFYLIQIKGTSSASSFNKSAYYNFQAYGPYDFVMKYGSAAGVIPTANPQDTSSGTVYQGNDLCCQIVTLTSAPAPTPESISFTASNVPAGVSVYVNGIPADGATPSCVTDNVSTFCSLSLTFQVASTAAKGTNTITLTGNASPSGTSHTITFALTVDAPPVSYNVRGWAWSEHLGWISFNSQNCDTNLNQLMDDGDFTAPVSPNSPASTQCPSIGTAILSYGAHLDLSTYELSGRVWSPEIGWISFEKTDTGTPFSAPYNNGSQSYIARLVSGKMDGWGRAISCFSGQECDAANQWGWIKLSGTASDGSPYAVGNSANELVGWAWGGNVIGWMSFSRLNCDTNANGVMDVGDTTAPAQCPPKDGITAIPDYKVWVAGTLPNAPPEALNPQSTFLNRCSLNAPFVQNLTFNYRDNEGDPLVQYTINVYDASTNALVDGPLTLTYASPYAYDPAPGQEMLVTYPYTGSLLVYGRTYYFTVEVRDPAHLN
ncbi:hypothetical protein HY250_01960, partial [Candidatus Azambacteria bacterium]|nr:hypothetical protein [Candidatus Azambacteria bacterium]